MSKAHESKGHEGSGKVEKMKEAPGGEAKKPEMKGADSKKAETQAPLGTKGKGHDPLPGGCFSWSCKVQATKFNFCEEHYDHFKFGLIKKTGEPVADYEKKIEHYNAHQTKSKGKRGASRAA